MAEYKVLIYGLGEQYNRNFNIIRYFDMTGQFRMIGVTARHTPDAVKLDGYPVIKYEEICKSGFDFIVVMSDIYFREIVDDLTGLGIGRRRILPYRVLQIPSLDFERYIAFRDSDISIISNNCWGGTVCHTLGIECRSPFKNLFVREPDYLKLLARFRYYMGCDLTFLNYAFSANSKKNYPVMLLYDIEVHCNHDTDPGEAAEKWNRRRIKINYENLFIEMYTESRETMEAFLKIEGYKRKLCFVPFETDAENVRQLTPYPGQKYFWEAVNSNAGNGPNSIVYNSLNLLLGMDADRQEKE